jgi:glutamate racemase
MKIGVFDSGVGGLSVAIAIQKALPEVSALYREDKENLPYGTKTPDQLFGLVTPILEQMVQDGCQVIVIACNTVTTTLIKRLREVIAVPLVGMEPMVKPAAEQTKSKVIAVFATPTTLGSERYAWLKQEYAKDVMVIEPDCSTWAKMVEQNKIEEKEIKDNVDAALKAGADMIVLGCTHYHWIEELVQSMAKDKAKVIQPEQPVIEQLKRVIEKIET